MGIRVTCPTCNRQLNVKSFLAGKRGVCPDCKTKFDIPSGSEHNVIIEVEESESTLSARQADLEREEETFALPIQLAPQPVPQTAAPLFPSFDPSPAPVAAPYSPAIHPGYGEPAFSPPGPAPAMAVPVIAPPMMAPVAPDVIAQAPQAAWHICAAAGEKYGPVSGETLRQWVAERRLLPDSLVWRDGWTDWQRADSLFAELAIAPVPPTIAAPMAIPVTSASAPGMFPAAEPPAEFPPLPHRRVRAGRSQGRRSKNTHLLVLILLILSVLVLAPLLGYVLVR